MLMKERRRARNGEDTAGCRTDADVSAHCRDMMMAMMTHICVCTTCRECFLCVTDMSLVCYCCYLGSHAQAGPDLLASLGSASRSADRRLGTTHAACTWWPLSSCRGCDYSHDAWHYYYCCCCCSIQWRPRLGSRSSSSSASASCCSKQPTPQAAAPPRLMITGIMMMPTRAIK